MNQAYNARIVENYTLTDCSYISVQRQKGLSIYLKQ